MEVAAKNGINDLQFTPVQIDAIRDTNNVASFASLEPKANSFCLLLVTSVSGS